MISDVSNDMSPRICQNLTLICVVDAKLWSLLISTTMWRYSLIMKIDNIV